MRYRKKPVIIEAVQWVGDVESFREIQALNPDAKLFPQWKSDTIAIPTLEGELTANLGDYIIKGVQGELYPCKPDIFKQTYDELPD